MAVNQTAAMKVGLCLLAFHGRISSLQPHFQHLPTLPLRLLFSQSLKIFPDLALLLSSHN
ncbi:hypothetical protein PVK06_041004 [Gossypium arboreum]|uniref:Uncharacterized protein n=1 Tax=Gossypium arboreum TaxID=29729 RepID=A0ABR0N710_GOSAR|nr:hypothetical protein PVK06_041004 [Gossypium arboreum]